MYYFWGARFCVFLLKCQATTVKCLGIRLVLSQACLSVCCSMCRTILIYFYQHNSLLKILETPAKYEVFLFWLYGKTLFSNYSVYSFLGNFSLVSSKTASHVHIEQYSGNQRKYQVPPLPFSFFFTCLPSKS